MTSINTSSFRRLYKTVIRRQPSNDLESGSRKGHEKDKVKVEVHYSQDQTPELERAFRPLTISLRIFGLVWESDEKKSISPTNCHCALVLAICWLNAVRFFFTFDVRHDSNARLFQKTIYGCISWQYAVGITAFVYARYKHIPRLTALWEEYKNKHGGITHDSIKKHTGTLMSFMNIILACLLSCALIFVSFRSPDWAAFQASIWPFRQRGLDTPSAGVFFYNLIQIYISMAWVQTAIYTVVYCYLLKREFKFANYQFKAAAEKSAVGKNIAPQPPSGGSSGGGGGGGGGGKSPRNLLKNPCSNNPGRAGGAGGGGVPQKAPGPTIIKTRHIGLKPEVHRKRHLELTLLCSSFDGILAKFLTAVFILDVPIVTISFSSCFFTPSSELLTLYGAVVCLVHVAVHLVAISLVATSMTSAAKGPKSVLHGLDLPYASPQEALTIQVFLQKVTLDHTGLTVCNIVNINRPLLVFVLIVMFLYVIAITKFALMTNVT